jgi:hypothetical protein
MVTFEKGWTKPFLDRIEKAAKETNSNVIFYPERVDRDVYDPKWMAWYTWHSMEWLFENRPKPEDEIIFLSIFQMPVFQLFYTGLFDIKHSMIVHSEADVSRFKYFASSEYIIKYVKVVSNLIFQTKHTSLKYDKCKSKKIIGGFLNRYDDCKDAKQESVMWSGYRVNDDTKDYAGFLKTVKANPNLKFVACLDQHISTIGYPNLTVKIGLNSEEYFNECKKAKYILSTSRADSFSYSLFDAISLGCIPVVSDIPQHKEWIPEKFVFKDIPDFNITATNAELKKIVDYHYYADTFLRLIND